MFITYSLIISIIVLVFCISFYIWGYTLLKSQAKTEISNLSTTFSQTLDNQIQIMDSVSLNVLYSNLVKQTFSNYISLNEGKPSNDTTASRLDNTKQLTDVLMGILGPNMPVKQINLYDFNGQMFGTGTYNTDIKSSVSSLSWYNIVVANAGKKYLTLPHDDVQVSRPINANINEKYISLCREYFDKYNNPQGIVEVEQDYNTIFDLLENSNLSKECVYVFNDSGDIIYPRNLSKNEISTTVFSSQNGLVTIKNSSTKQNELLSYVHSTYTGWTTVVVISEQSFLQPVYIFSLVILLSTFVLLVLALYLSFVTAKKITSPISKLRKLVKNIDYNAMPMESLIEIKSGFIELEELNHAFFKMNLRVNKSVEEAILSHQNEMQSRMLALQSKMNPHFLYNTLSILSAMAEENMNKQIKEICINVSDMLRYISSDASLVKIDNEILYINQYISCVKYFYGEKLFCSIDIDKAMYELKIPKLMIQPLVENAIKHGTKNSPPWIIKVKGFIKDGCWQIIVEDNGAGFDINRLDELKQKINEINQTGLLPCLEIEGMGLLNIYMRLKMTYGDSAIFEISNNAIGETIILIGGNITIDE
jgi:two-component system sensor histidine kinase YesM